jgi:hypothetical protein
LIFREFRQGLEIGGVLQERTVKLSLLEEVDEEFEVVVFQVVGDGDVFCEAFDPSRGQTSVCTNKNSKIWGMSAKKRNYLFRWARLRSRVWHI